MEPFSLPWAARVFDEPTEEPQAAPSTRCAGSGLCAAQEGRAARLCRILGHQEAHEATTNDECVRVDQPPPPPQEEPTAPYLTPFQLFSSSHQHYLHMEGLTAAPRRLVVYTGTYTLKLLSYLKLFALNALFKKSKNCYRKANASPTPRF